MADACERESLRVVMRLLAWSVALSRIRSFLKDHAWTTNERPGSEEAATHVPTNPVAIRHQSTSKESAVWSCCFWALEAASPKWGNSRDLNLWFSNPHSTPTNAYKAPSPTHSYTFSPSSNNHFHLFYQQQHLLNTQSHLQWLAPSKLPVSNHLLIILPHHRRRLLRVVTAGRVFDASLALAPPHLASTIITSLYLLPSSVAYIHSQASPLVARLPVSSSPPRPLASQHLLPEVSRSLTATSPVPSLSVRSVATRSRPSSSSASSPSSVWFVRSPRTSSRTSASSLRPSALSRSPLRPTSSLSSRTPTSAPSTPSVSPSRARTSSSPAVSAVSALKLLTPSSWQLDVLSHHQHHIPPTRSLRMDGLRDIDGMVGVGFLLTFFYWVLQFFEQGNDMGFGVLTIMGCTKACTDSREHWL